MTPFIGSGAMRMGGDVVVARNTFRTFRVHSPGLSSWVFSAGRMGFTSFYPGCRAVQAVARIENSDGTAMADREPRKEGDAQAAREPGLPEISDEKLEKISGGGATLQDDGIGHGDNF